MLDLFVSFEVPGRPVPKERPRTGQGRTYTPKKTLDHEQAVRDRAWAAMVKGRVSKNLSDDLGIIVTFHLPDRRRVDIDNLLKTVLDGLNGMAFKDDSQIVKVYAGIDRSTKLAKSDVGLWVVEQRPLGKS